MSRRRDRIAKAAPAAAPSGNPVFQLSDMQIDFVSLVPAGANRQRKWLVRKADGTAPELPPGPDAGTPTAPAEEAPPTPSDKPAFCPYCGAALPVGAVSCPGCDRPVPELVEPPAPASAAPAAPAEPPEEEPAPVEDGCAGGSKDEEERRRRELASVPAADASPEDKRAAQEGRAGEYGIQALAGPEANLSWPADAPTTLELYGDPVNLKYPLGGAGNTADPARIRNALARFKQAAASYTEDASRGKVYGRIVAAALAQGIAVSYDPNDPIDKLLPAEVKARLEELNKAGAGATAPAPSPGGTPPSPGTDLSGWLADVGAKVEARFVDARLSAALAAPQPAAAAAPAPAPAPTTKAPAIAADGPGAVAKAAAAEQQAATQEAARLRAELDAQRAEVARLAKGVGLSKALPVGERPTTQPKPDAGPAEAVARAWRGGGDLAAAVSKP